ncbi:MAG: serine--tRNA ligase [Bacteroidota bacterium]
MLEIHYICRYKDTVIQRLQARQMGNAADAVAQLLAIDQQRRKFQECFDTASAKLHQLAKQVAQLRKEDKKEEVATLRSQSRALKATIKELGDQLKIQEEALQHALDELPNLPHPAVPVGASASENEIVYQTEELLQPTEGSLPHWELAAKYDIIDFALGSRVAGTGFPVYKGKGAKLQRALINFFLDKAVRAGYQEIQPPILVNQDAAYGTGQLPDKEGQMYQLLDQKLYLIPTAEVPLTNLYRQQILSQEMLPIRNVAYTPCFRREAGSWGRHVKGLNRLHQFDKVELVEVVQPQTSYRALETMRSHVEKLLQQLALPYRAVKLCSGELGFTAAFTYDLEVFSVAQDRWLEVSSISNFETYQATRMKLRYRTKSNAIQLLHTLNGSALALPRVMAALLEHNQTEKGISIPPVLRPYTGFDCIT